MLRWLRTAGVLLLLASASACMPSDPVTPEGVESIGQAVTQASLAVTFRDTTHRILGLDRDGTLYGTWYADGSNALWVSTDGRNWTRRAAKTVAGTPSIMTPLADGTLLMEAKLSGSQSLWRSTDHGVTWKQVLVTGNYRMLQTHSIRELDGTVFFGEYQSFSSEAEPVKLWMSTDRGATWSVRYVFQGVRHVHSLAVDPDRHELWALLGDGEAAGLMRSRDHGQTFQFVVAGKNGVAVDTVMTPLGWLFGTDTFREPYPSRIAIVAPDDSESFVATIAEPSYSVLAVAGGGYLLGTTRETSSEFDALDSAYMYASGDGVSWQEVARYHVDDLTQYGRADVHWQLPSGEVVIELSSVDGMPTRGGYLLARASFDQTVPTTHEVSFQDRVLPTASYAGAQDAWIGEATPTTRHGTATRARFDGNEPDGTGKDDYALLRWDVTAIPATGVVTAATVTLQVTDPTSRTYEVYPLLRSWSETQVTWNEAASGSPWGLAGARGASDRSSTVIGQAAPLATGSYSFPLNAAGVALVQSWVNDPTKNRGFVIANATNANGVIFVARESIYTTQRPKLTVTYQTP